MQVHTQNQAPTIIQAFQDVPFAQAIDIISLAVTAGKQACQSIADLPFTDLYLENGWTGYWVESDFNGDGYIEPREGFDIIEVCGAIANDFAFAQTLANLAF